MKTKRKDELVCAAIEAAEEINRLANRYKKFDGVRDAAVDAAEEMQELANYMVKVDVDPDENHKCRRLAIFIIGLARSCEDQLTRERERQKGNQ